MYTFEAHYIDYYTEEEKTLTIEIDSQDFEEPKAIYLEAMERAYDLMGVRDDFKSLELISC
jgi:hypothetical protein